MSSTAAPYTTSAGAGRPRISALRIWGTGLAAAAISSVANLIVKLAADLFVDFDRRFQPLGVGPIIFFSFLFILVGTGVFHLIARMSRRPVRTFLTVAAGGLLLSLVPDLMLLFADMGPMGMGVTTPAVITLIIMHLVSGAITVYLLATQALKR
jgi:hypothetical protein